jgi:hypothetical protein
MDSQRTELDILEDLTPLSTALVDIPLQLPNAYVDLPSGTFIVINLVICFKKFERRFLNGISDAYVSRALDQIRRNSGFRDLCSIVWDNSDNIPFDKSKKNFFFGKRSNLQIMWEYCILSKVDMEESGDILDESDVMIVEDFKRINMEFYNQSKKNLSL